VFCPYGLYPPARTGPRCRRPGMSRRRLRQQGTCMPLTRAARPHRAELAPGVRLGPPVAIETRLIADWGIWVDGRGVVEGADTESAGHHLS
jgi:hypothetical protein